MACADFAADAEMGLLARSIKVVIKKPPALLLKKTTQVSTISVMKIFK